jgi:hypothetical protein
VVVVHVPPSTTSPPDWARVSEIGANLAVMTPAISARKKARREDSEASFVSRSNVRASIPDYPVGQEPFATVSASIDVPMVFEPACSQIISHYGQRIDAGNLRLMPHVGHRPEIVTTSSIGSRRIPRPEPGRRRTWRPR